jgi:hypothetical protein
MPDKAAAAARDCLDCGTKDGMKLQNALGRPPTNIPLLYVCLTCGCTLTIPPPLNPLVDHRRRDT